MIRTGFFALGLSLASSAAAETTVLEAITVEGSAVESGAQQVETQRLQRGAGNETLGGYLDALPNVDSASYGEAVGRPVVRGMSGYRVKILQNDNELSDLSAMSQDHAVAIAPRAAERIELLKGPASLLYAARAGGVIRIQDALDAPFPKAGLQGKISGDWRPDPESHGLDGQLTMANAHWALNLGGLHQQADAYKAGNGDLVPDSDLRTEQGQFGLGWRPNKRSEWQLNTTRLEKDYGIPNETDAVTRINLEREDVGAKLRYQPSAPWLDLVTVDVLQSDYLHDETEGGRKDGLFGQKQLSGAVNLSWATDRWLGDTRLLLADSELRVCHEHGGCDRFDVATRSGGPLGESVAQYLESAGLPYSHGHPMPDSDSRVVQLSTLLQTELQSRREFSMGLNWERRELELDPGNIQEQWVYPPSLDPGYYAGREDDAFSLSLGLTQAARNRSPGWDLSLSYLERIPSVDELYWNGFHHATDSYIFGNPDLAKEKSLNLDVDVSWELDRQRIQLSAFHYRFDDYIYQETGFAPNGAPLVDPFHLSDVWFTRHADANFTGGALRYENSMTQFRGVPVTFWGQVDVVDARKRAGGALPRTSPLNSEIGVRYEPSSWSINASFKRVNAATKLAERESSTPGYDWLSLSLERTWEKAAYEVQWWLKGENLQDSLAFNHLSFLKATAPLPGRQITTGLELKF
ncbi:MAG: TonB-dependent receptor [Thiotrichales bacterium]